MPFAQANGIQIHYEIQGSGHPLVCIMGLGYGAWAWHRLTPLLAPHYQTVTFDNRGAERSDQPEGPYSVQMMAADTAGLLDALDIRAAYIFGVSLGGLIAQELAFARPDLVGKLILAATMPGGSNIIPVPPETIAIIMEREGDPLALTQRRILQACAPGFAERHPDLLQQLFDYRLSDPVRATQYLSQAQAAFNYELLSEEEVSRRLQSIAVPTLILFGEHDRVVPTANAQLLAAQIPGSRVTAIPEGGHMFVFECPEETANSVIEFLG